MCITESLCCTAEINTTFYVNKIKKTNQKTRKIPHTNSAAAAAKSLQSCPTLCDPIDGSPPGSAAGILQARTLEWVVISFSNV